MLASANRSRIRLAPPWLTSSRPATSDTVMNGLANIGSIGATLVYFDLRVRREGYTLEQMATEVSR